MNDDAIASLDYIMEQEIDDFVDVLSTGAEIGLTEEECEEIYDLDRGSDKFAKLIEKACNGGSMHIYARAYRGQFC